MPPIKPEAALDKAKKMYAIGKIDSAIELLSDCMKGQKKSKAWNKIQEDLMMFLAELCVESKKSLQFKEVIHQYKNMTAHINPKSLEDVVKRYLTLAKLKTEEAREKAEIGEDVEDLEGPDTAESLIMSISASEGEKGDRGKLTPWLKFLWESYRQCMELLRNNSRFERQYHDIVEEAAEFCRKYERKTEFKKLSEMLRNHMLKLQTQNLTITNQTTSGINSAATTGVNNAESWTYHHETRLKQLEQAMQFGLYNEAFRAVDDIWNLINNSTIPVKSRIMANCYIKTAKVLFESGCSYLFHAATLHRLFFFSRENKKNLSASDLEHMATQMIIASLSIPLPNIRDSVDPLLESGEISNPVKQKQLSLQLKLPNLPTRTSLIKDILHHRIHELVKPELKQLFQTLEFDYKPLSMAKEAAGVLEWLENDKEFHVYANLIKETIVSKVLIQVGKVYKTMKISEFEKLCPFVDPMHLMSIVNNLIRNLELPVRIDMQADILQFDAYTDLGISQRNDNELVVEEINGISSLSRQLCKFSAAIYEVADFIGYKDEKKESSLDWIKQSYLRTINESHMAIMKRKDIIEQRKEEIEQAEEEHAIQMNQHIRNQEEKRRKEEHSKLLEEREQQQRRQMMQDKEMNQRKMLEVRKSYLEGDEAGKELLSKYTEDELAKMDNVELAKIHNEEKQRMRIEEEERLKKLEQKVDFFQRACRLEEISLIEEAQKENFIIAQKLFEEHEVHRKIKAQEEHKMQLKNRDICLKFKKEVMEYFQEVQKQKDNQYIREMVEWEEQCEKIKKDYRVKRRIELIESENQRKQQAIGDEQKRQAEMEAVKQPEPTESKKYIPPSKRKAVTIVAENNESKRNDENGGWRSVTKH